MKRRFSLTFSLNQKLWLTVILMVVAAVIVAYAGTNIFYKKLYVEQMESSLRNEADALAAEYTGGDISPDLQEKVEWYNKVSEAEVFLVNNPRELSACLPFDIDYQSIIGEKERRELVNGKVITKLGYEERFNRQIMGVIMPLLDENRLKGIIYLYIPLATVDEIFQEARLLIIGIGALFTIAILLIGRVIIKKLTSPLKRMERIAYQMSQGQFREKVPITTNDEIGRLGKAFNQMADALKEEDERRQEFLGNVSHELRTPISYLKGYSEALKDGIVESKEDQKKYLGIIHREAKRMQRLVHDLLELAKMEGDLFPLEKTPLVFAQLIEDTLEKFEHPLVEKNLKLKTDLNPDVIVLGDEDRLEQVIHNIVDNAIRYTPSGGAITVRLTEGTEYCRLSVEDTGVGIPQESLHRIGERFYRVDKARSRESGGTGLGIGIVKNIIQKHNGKWHIDSEEGKGTTVTVQLPQMK
ncbi:ATP-binding protein [Bacillus tianshenii]|nr:ATP-binding protein [Bacillus tianshenii]